MRPALQILVVGVLLGLLLDPALTSVSGATQLAERCGRHEKGVNFLSRLDAPLREAVEATVEKHGERIDRMLRLYTDGSKANSQQLDQGTDTVAFVELEFGLFGCLFTSVIGTLCVLFSIAAMRTMLQSSFNFTPVNRKQQMVTFEEFGDFAQRVYQREKATTGLADTPWALPPSEFTDEQQKQFREFMFEKKPAPEHLRPYFEMRRAMEKSKYDTFLKSDVMKLEPSGSNMVNALTVLFAMFQVATVVFLYNFDNFTKGNTESQDTQPGVTQE